MKGPIHKQILLIFNYFPYWRPTFQFSSLPSLSLVHFSVVPQSYSVNVMDESILRGNSAILKCHIPSFVADFILVDSWVEDEEREIYPQADVTASGKPLAISSPSLVSFASRKQLNPVPCTIHLPALFFNLILVFDLESNRFPVHCAARHSIILLFFLYFELYFLSSPFFLPFSTFYFHIPASRFIPRSKSRSWLAQKKTHPFM